MNNILIIARKEVQEGLRNRWVFATTLLLAALALTLTFLGSAPTGNVGANALDVVIVSLSSLTIFLVPLIALLISHDAIVGEVERGTMLLLLSYPVGRWQVLAGKFLGHLGILAFATLLGYGAAGAALATMGGIVEGGSLVAFAKMILSSIILGAVFIAIGYFVSALVRERSTAAGVAIGVWLLFVLIYDMALLGGLLVSQDGIFARTIFPWLLLLNPADAFRVYNMAAVDGSLLQTGLGTGASGLPLEGGSVLLSPVLWCFAALGLATLAFRRVTP